MRPLFTVHAGEYLVGSFIEANYPNWNVWVPAKDTNIDLLVTNASNTRTVTLHVKFSRDFNPTNRQNLLQNKLTATGWWTHQAKKIKDSNADFWIYALPSFAEHKTYFIIIPPKELLRRFRSIHNKLEKKIHSYLSVTKSGHCWEARGLNNVDQELLAFDRYRNADRDFTQFLNNWSVIEKRLKK